ncbi:BRO family protein [Zhenhengia yiwuensis]|uniref:BRO family protein n=1 Tax=Zhenhengia yiwuensis TaxID=2763666 RepID=UPI0020161EB2
MVEALGYADTKSAIADHVDTEDKQIIQKGQFTTLEIPNRGLTVINESGLYSLILINKFSLAKEFKSWLYIKNIAINYYLSVLIAPLFPLLCLDSIRAKIMVEIV